MAQTIRTLESVHELALLHMAQGHYEKTELLSKQARQGREQKLGNEHPGTLDSLNNLMELYEVWGKPEKAEEWRAKTPQEETMNE